MTWAILFELICDEAGPDAARRIEDRARLEMGGQRITVCPRKPVTARDIHNMAPGKPARAAKKLGIHKSTAYRVLKRKERIIR